MAERGWLVLRLPYELAEGERAIVGFVGPEVRAFGDMYVHLYSPAPAAAGAPATEEPG